ncbi:MAG TPA: ParB N-terminal domain-containing protein, partial [Puia sp.]|nr:ParB N-terminal domain-containing protein [Puia sp.]
MSETAHSPEPVANPPQIVMMPTDGLFVPDWNPRKTMSEAGLRILVDFVKAGKPLERLLVWKGSGQAAGSPKEPAQPGLASRLESSTQAPLAVISGQRRLEAYRRAGVKLVEVEILDIPLEDAKDRASTS